MRYGLEITSATQHEWPCSRLHGAASCEEAGCRVLTDSERAAVGGETARLRAVERNARALSALLAEFPDFPSAWSEQFGHLDRALAALALPNDGTAGAGGHIHVCESWRTTMTCHGHPCRCACGAELAHGETYRADGRWVWRLPDGTVAPFPDPREAEALLPEPLPREPDPVLVGLSDAVVEDACRVLGERAATTLDDAEEEHCLAACEALRALASAAEAWQTMRDDLLAAADELLIPVPEPGTDLARVCLANRMLKRENERLADELERGHA